MCVCSRRSELGAGRGELDFAHVLSVDPDPLEDGLVEETPGVAIRQAVGRVYAIGHAECNVEPLEGLGVIDSELILSLLSGEPPAPDAAQLVGEQLRRDQFVVVGLEQFFS
jgi:hypothetical protein